MYTYRTCNRILYTHAYITWAGIRAQRWHCAVPFDSVSLGSRIGSWCVHSAPATADDDEAPATAATSRSQLVFACAGHVQI
eukprot:7365138-Pyramimonas_sp.AAC.1